MKKEEKTKERYNRLLKKGWRRQQRDAEAQRIRRGAEQNRQVSPSWKT
jgi:hypothetical protein